MHNQKNATPYRTMAGFACACAAAILIIRTLNVLTLSVLLLSVAVILVGLVIRLVLARGPNAERT
jgi:Flp pilus assembly protein TadB